MQRDCTKKFYFLCGPDLAFAGRWLPQQAGRGHGRLGRAPGRCGCAVTSLLQRDGCSQPYRTQVGVASCPFVDSCYALRQQNPHGLGALPVLRCHQPWDLVLPAILLLLAGGVAWGFGAAGGGGGGAAPGRGPPPAAWRGAAVLCRRWLPSPCRGAARCSRFCGWPATAGGSRAAVCGRRPEDAHALWQRVVGVLRSMPVAGCVRVSGSVGRL
jgi:hypothetical protein